MPTTTRISRGRAPARALCVLASLALVAGFLFPTAAGASAATTRHPTARPLYWGAWIGDQMTGTKPPWDMNAVSAFEGVVHKGLSLIGLASPFAECPAGRSCTFFPFPTQAMENARAYGAIPVLSWASQATPYVPGQIGNPEFQLSDVIAGKYDSYIGQFATEARDWGHPFFLRFNWEMNGNWFPWSEGVNGNNPGEFVAAWRHVHDIFAAVGATNATWVWCPYADSNKKRFSSIRPLYPGDSYVDWTCMDGYNWGKAPVNPHPWKSFTKIFEPTYTALTTKVAPHKPVLLGEMASGTAGGHKGAWIREMFADLPTRFPRVRGLVWYDAIDRGIDWPIETSAAATSAFSSGVRKGIYVGNRFAGLTESPIRPPRR